MQGLRCLANQLAQEALPRHGSKGSNAGVLEVHLHLQSDSRQHTENGSGAAF